jgi:hypothetical protein
MDNQRIMVSFSAAAMNLCSPKHANYPRSPPASYSISIGRGFLVFLQGSYWIVKLTT